MSASHATGSVLRILTSRAARESLVPAVAAELRSIPHAFVDVGDNADVAFVSRDVTGRSTKHRVLPDTQRFYDALLAAESLRWVQAHSAGADRAIYVALRARGVVVTTSSGVNAPIVVQTALAGILALVRRFPHFFDAQRRRAWEPVMAEALPPELAGRTAVIVGWGPIGRALAQMLSLLGMRIAVVRGGDEAAEGAFATTRFESIATLLPEADWLVLACPLSDRTRGLVGRDALALLPRGAHVVNVARGEVVDEPALTAALACGHVGGAYLDVFAEEPLPVASPLWALPNVIVTPHNAGHSPGNEQRTAALFVANLGRWTRGETLAHVSG